MKISIKKYTHECLVILGVLAAYLPIFFWMWDRWFAEDSYYSHGILVPFITGYLIWLKRNELAKWPRESSPLGMPLIIGGIFIHILSSLLRVYFLSLFSLIPVILGFVLFFYGSKILKKILFPILFLMFMMPLPLVVIVNLSFNLKLYAADMAKGVLQGMGFHVIREGSSIIMPHASIVVEDVCSGLRSLISLAALGSVFAYWMKGSFLKKVFIFLSTVPVAILTNVIRIVFVSFVAEVYGGSYAVGFIHDLSGLLVFVLAFGMMYVLVKLIE